MLRKRWTSGRHRFVAYAVVALLLLPAVLFVRAAEQSINLDGNSVNGAESRIETRVLQSYPVKIENVIFNEAIGKSFTFDWDGAGPGGFHSFVTAGPGVGTKWEWTTVSQVYSILSPATFEQTSRGLPVFGAPPAGIQIGTGASTTFVVPGKSIYPTQVTVSAASLTSSLINFFSPEKTIATCGGTYLPGRYEQTISNHTDAEIRITVEQPDCCPEPHMVICEDGCQFYQSDPLNCGGCGIECASDEICAKGACEPICPGETLCGEKCVDTQNDSRNCGGCGLECASDEFCAEGACEPICPGETLCGETCVDTQNDSHNCGGCDIECAFDAYCAEGACEPICPGQTLCGETCVDTQNDARNCGGCGIGCAFDHYCSSGTCQPICPSGQTLCGETCVDTQDDERNCGGCGIGCAFDHYCSGGTCQPICPSGQTLCGETCVDTQSDPSHCGGCNQECAGTKICDDGLCVPAPTPEPSPTPTPEPSPTPTPEPSPTPTPEPSPTPTPEPSPTPTPEPSPTPTPSPSPTPEPMSAGALLSTNPLRSNRPVAERSRAARGSAAGASSGRRPAEDRAAPAARRTALAGTVAEAPVCDLTPVEQIIPAGGSFTQCQSGSLVGKEVFTFATVQQNGQAIAQGPCSMIVPDLEAEIPPFLPSPVAVVVQDESGDGLCQPYEECELFVSVQNLGGSALLNPIGTLGSVPDEFNPLPITITRNSSFYPDFPAYPGGGNCETVPRIDPQTNKTAFSLILPREQEPDVARVFQLSLLGDNGGPTVTVMPFVLGIGRSCDPATDIDGETYDGIRGFLSPVSASLVPQGNPVHQAPGTFSRSEAIPLRLQLLCGGHVLGPDGIEPNPEVVALVHATLGPQPLVHINGARDADPDDLFFDCGKRRGDHHHEDMQDAADDEGVEASRTNQCEFKLRAKDLPVGAYVVSVRMPDSRVFQAGLTIRP